MYFVLALVLQSQTPPVQPPPELPVSIERIRRGLDQTPTITVTYGMGNLTPFFRVNVEEQWLDIERQWQRPAGANVRSPVARPDPSRVPRDGDP